jgi:2-oxoglutarate/2-oxoacid ferredoxin oxidoreductase subunit beta
VTKSLSPDDFASDQDVRWCPGCGDYAILKAVQKTLAELDADPDNTVFVSGIGCSSRFPYYLSTYGFHTIHGRAPAIATGVKLQNPGLDVWVVTGDGDGLSIGGNHLYHVLRRNVDLQILLFNNEIYGLTKGQYSPTSRRGIVTPSTLKGSLDCPVSPCRFALGVGATFIARAIDIDQSSLVETLKQACKHRGASFVEILQNCPVFNDGAFESVSAKKSAPERRLVLRHGEPMLFGAKREKGLRLNTQTLQVEIVDVGGGSAEQAGVLVHDMTNANIAALIVGLPRDEFPTPVGVIHAREQATFDSDMNRFATSPGGRQSAGKRGMSLGEVEALLRRGHVWTAR